MSRIDHLSILVSSMDASMPYYRALMPLLGFEEARPNVWSDGKGLAIHFAAAAAGSRPYERLGSGLNHLGFRLADLEAVRHIGSRMAAAGFPVPEMAHFDDASCLFMADPDGLRFEISCAREAVAA